MAEKSSIEEMAGEAFREVGVLLFVFANLDELISGKITIWSTIITVLISAAFFLTGCFIERIRPNE